MDVKLHISHEKISRVANCQLDKVAALTNTETIDTRLTARKANSASVTNKVNFELIDFKSIVSPKLYRQYRND